MKSLLWFLPLLFLLTSACDRTVIYNFQVSNLSSYQVIVDYSVSQIDTTLELIPNQEASLYEEQRFGKGEDFVGTEMYLFSRLSIRTADSVIGNQDYFQRELWRFMKSKSSASYTLTLQDSDFD